MRMMNFCKLLFAVLLFFATFKLFLVFLRLFLTLFSLRKNMIKNGTLQAEYVTRKLKWKFAIRDSWFVTMYFGPWTVPETPPPCTTLFEVSV